MGHYAAPIAANVSLAMGIMFGRVAYRVRCASGSEHSAARVKPIGCQLFEACRLWPSVTYGWRPPVPDNGNGFHDEHDR
jgi:hypothetical protein